VLKNKSKLGTFLLILSVVLSPFFYFSSDLTPWKTSSLFSLALQQVYQPIELLWHNTTHTTSRVYTRYFNLVGAQRENETLRNRLAQLQTRVMDYEHQVNEVNRLRKLLDFSDNYKKEVLVAEVISSGSNSLFPALRINRGSIHDLTPGMPVLSANGVIGRIIRTGLNFSDVQLTSDSNFSVDIVIERTRVRGVVSGTKENQLRLELKRKMDIKIGDTVITSGIVGGFPKGLPVGRVVRIAYETDQLSQVVTIEPWADYKRLEEVLVIFNNDKQLNMILETAGSNWLKESNSGG
jgi:rod shape-determining protein MreC